MKIIDLSNIPILIMERDYYINDLTLIEDLENVERAHLSTRKVKQYKVRQNPLELLEEAEFRQKYRFSRSTAIFIIDMVKNNLVHDTRGEGIPPYLQVLTAIRTWARGEVQDDAGDLSGISQPQVSIICKRVALALVSKRDEFIKMPQSELEQNKVIRGFYATAGFRQVIGAIDCTHIKIPKVGGEIGQYYINRKGYSSLNVQVICNADLEIMDIVAHWRGSTHDSRIFNESRIKTRFERSEFKGRLLGDSGYACTPYLFTPLLNPSSIKENAYNYAHIRTRNAVERCFGVWKQRFRCLLKGFTTNLENSKLYIVVLAILHNIAVKREEIEELSIVPDDFVNEDHNVEAGNHIRGNAARAAFIEQNF